MIKNWYIILRMFYLSDSQHFMYAKSKYSRLSLEYFVKNKFPSKIFKPMQSKIQKSPTFPTENQKIFYIPKIRFLANILSLCKVKYRKAPLFQQKALYISKIQIYSAVCKIFCKNKNKK